MEQAPLDTAKLQLLSAIYVDQSWNPGSKNFGSGVISGAQLDDFLGIYGHEHVAAAKELVNQGALAEYPMRVSTSHAWYYVYAPNPAHPTTKGNNPCN